MRTDILGIGSAIRALLVSDQDLQEAIEGRVYPLVAEENATFPFLCYGLLGVRPDETKDGKYAFGDTATVGVLVATETYKESVDLSILVRSVLTKFEGVVSDYHISSITLSDATDDYSDGAFYRNLTFEIETEN